MGKLNPAAGQDRRDFMASALGAVSMGVMGTNALFGATPTITVVELRQYTLRGGRREELIELFQSKFVEPQEAVGAFVLGTFRDLDDADRFVWIRGFRDMAQRHAALDAFYTGPVWRANRDAANATILDSDNVLLLRPLAESDGLLAPHRPSQKALVRISIHYLAGVSRDLFADFFNSTIRPLVADASGTALAALTTETQPNDFPRLPVREHESLFVWMARVADASAESRLTSQLANRSGWRDRVSEQLLPALMRKPEVLRLSPTSRSPL
jgi:NIPSNAP